MTNFVLAAAFCGLALTVLHASAAPAQDSSCNIAFASSGANMVGVFGGDDQVGYVSSKPGCLGGKFEWSWSFGTFYATFQPTTDLNARFRVCLRSKYPLLQLPMSQLPPIADVTHGNVVPLVSQPVDVDHVVLPVQETCANSGGEENIVKLKLGPGRGLFKAQWTYLIEYLS